MEIARPDEIDNLFAMIGCHGGVLINPDSADPHYHNIRTRVRAYKQYMLIFSTTRFSAICGRIQLKRDDNRRSQYSRVMSENRYTIFDRSCRASQKYVIIY